MNPQSLCDSPTVMDLLSSSSSSSFPSPINTEPWFGRGVLRFQGLRSKVEGLRVYRAYGLCVRLSGLIREERDRLFGRRSDQASSPRFEVYALATRTSQTRFRVRSSLTGRQKAADFQFITTRSLFLSCLMLGDVCLASI